MKVGGIVMKFNYDIPKEVASFIENSKLEEISIGCSNSQVIKISKEKDEYYLKMASRGMLTKEYEKLKWLDGKLAVPKIILYVITKEAEFLITKAIPGQMICNDYFTQNPLLGIKVIAEAFKEINKVDITDCPFDSSIDYKLEIVTNNVNHKLIKKEDLNEETLKKYGSIDNILNYLKEHKFYEPLCFSHGDTSLPNIFALNNQFSGLIDVGESGMADKWFDLAICEKSIKRNYGEDYITPFYHELGITPDRDKIDYYLLMMELYL